ncbi:MAG: hypothetical protein OEY99_07140 [Aigarchaeota archaeon]|nr:hypothetical protein [Aigarchaeota archaeon]
MSIFSEKMQESASSKLSVFLLVVVFFSQAHPCASAPLLKQSVKPL